MSATSPDSLERRAERLLAEGHFVIDESRRTIAEAKKLRARCRAIHSRQDGSPPNDGNSELGESSST